MTGKETTTKRSHLLRSLFISFNLSIFLLKLLQVGLLLKSGLLGKLWGKTWGQIQATQRGSVTTVPANLLRKSRVVFAFAVLNICFRGPTNMPSFLFFFSEAKKIGALGRNLAMWETHLWQILGCWRSPKRFCLSCSVERLRGGDVRTAKSLRLKSVCSKSLQDLAVYINNHDT